ncbi:MAG: ATP phosphoribosyltransferase [Candidatus Moraniibacteriota bacterium]
MLRIAIPKGSLEEGTFQLFKEADLRILRRGERDYNLQIDDPRISETFMLRPQEIPSYIQEGEFDLGITGYDWIVETNSNVQEVADLQFSKGGYRKVKIILATDNSNPVVDVKNIRDDARIVTEYPRITKDFFQQLEKDKVSIRLSHGATEIKVPRLADYLVDVTETGTTLRENGKKILAVILESSTKLIANIDSWNDPEKRQSMKDIAGLLMGVLYAKGRVLIKMNVVEKNLNALIETLPSMKGPTISSLLKRGNGGEKYFAVETIVEKSQLNILLPEIRRAGATDILEINVDRIMP